jgi:transcriptional regulator of acetoin/glycerol metabolism
MVVLSPGREIQPADIPAEVRSPTQYATSDFLPAPIPRAPSTEVEGQPSIRPQLEFIFRTLVDLRVDVDELKKEFEQYQAGLPALPPGAGEVGVVYGTPPVASRGPTPVGDLSTLDVLDVGEGGAGSGEGPGAVGSGPAGGGAEREDVVVYRPGMTMEDLEREAIAAALKEVDGNRRKAADLLGIGERTLYRKIRKYELDV